MRKKCNIISIYLREREGGKDRMRTIPMTQNIVAFKEINKQSAVDEYTEYFDWLQSNLDSDYSAVLNNNLEFLEMMYQEELCKLRSELNVDKCWNKLVLIDKNEKKCKKLRTFISNSKDIYSAINCLRDKQNLYIHFDNLGSWYSAQIDSTNKVLNKLSNSIQKKRDINTTVNYRVYVDANENYCVLLSGIPKREDK